MTGPWSDLPPSPPPPREPMIRWRRPRGARGAREPLIKNWRVLLIVIFLLFAAPPLASWLAHLIMERMNGGAGF